MRNDSRLDLLSQLKIYPKDPDGVYHSIEEFVWKEFDQFDADERDDLLELRREQMLDHVRQFVKYGEYITIEFDTEADTTIVRGFIKHDSNHY